MPNYRNERCIPFCKYELKRFKSTWAAIWVSSTYMGVINWKIAWGGHRRLRRFWEKNVTCYFSVWWSHQKISDSVPIFWCPPNLLLWSPHSPHTMPIINYVSLGILDLKKIATKKYFVLPKRFKNKRFINTILTLWFVNLVTFQSHDGFLRISCPIFIKIQSHNNLITFRIRRRP